MDRFWSVPDFEREAAVQATYGGCGLIGESVSFRRRYSTVRYDSAVDISIERFNATRENTKPRMANANKADDCNGLRSVARGGGA
jgi:hypothetical protein